MIHPEVRFDKTALQALPQQQVLGDVGFKE